MKYTERRLMGSIMTQTDYLEEFYPFSHRVMSDFYFPEFYNYTEYEDEEGKKQIEWNREETFRIGATIQCVTTVQQLVHLCGNDIHHELTNATIPSTPERKSGRFRSNILLFMASSSMIPHRRTPSTLTQSQNGELQ